MNFKTPLILLGAAISASSFAETLTYDGSAKGSFYDGAYWAAQSPQKLLTSSLTKRQKQPLMSLTQQMA